MDTERGFRGLVPFLLRDRVFRRYWCASTVSMFGDQVSSVALPLTAVLVLHAHAAQMGYLTALQWVPSMLFGLHVGSWADRVGRRRHLMIAADLGRALLLVAVPLFFAARLLTLWQLYAVAFGLGTLSIVFNVSDGTLFVSITKPPQYVDGQSLLYISRALSFVGGPALGGPLVQLLGAPFAILAVALSFLGSAFFLNRIRPAEPPPDTGRGKATDGLRFVARRGIVRSALVGVAVINFFHMMFSALFLLYAVRVLHVHAGMLGMVLGLGAFGGFGGSLVTKEITRRIGAGRACVVGCLLFTAPLALVPLATADHGGTALALLLVAEFASGFGVMLLDITAGTIFAAVIPGGVRSRVTGAFLAINYGTRPPGALLGGMLGTVLGLRETLWIAVCGGICGALILLPSPLSRFRLPCPLPEPPLPLPLPAASPDPTPLP
jgi:MFS family permease